MTVARCALSVLIVVLAVGAAAGCGGEKSLTDRAPFPPPTEGTQEAYTRAYVQCSNTARQQLQQKYGDGDDDIMEHVAEAVRARLRGGERIRDYAMLGCREGLAQRGR